MTIAQFANEGCGPVPNARRGVASGSHLAANTIRPGQQQAGDGNIVGIKLPSADQRYV